MSALTFARLREINVRRCVTAFNHPLEAWSVDDWLVAIGGEVGEALNVVKKLNRERDGIKGNTKTREELEADLGDELADAFIYIDLLLARQGVSLFDDTILGFAVAHEQTLVGLAQSSEPRRDLSEFGRHALRAVGRVCEAVVYPPSLQHAAQLLYGQLTMMAHEVGIDLGEAIVRKFNQTSLKVGFTEQLVA